MPKSKKLFDNFINNIRSNSNTWSIPQLKKAPSFKIKLVTNNKGENGFIVEKRVMPVDQFFPMKIFYFLIKKLEKAENKSLKKGNALKHRIGQPGLELTTVESLIAREFYKKKLGDSIDRRISVIANILVESSVCRHGRGELILVENNNSNNKPLTQRPITTRPNIGGLPNFLIENKAKIQSAPPQIISLVNKKYKHKKFLEFSIMKEFFTTFPNADKKSIQRADVNKLFRMEKYYLGFISAMIWGGINASKPREKEKFETIDFYRLLKEDRKKITEITLKVKKLLLKGQHKFCFDYLYNEGKINGIGHAYFTKLMYFMGHNYSKIKLKPLIFDKWTSNAYLALLINSNQYDKIKRYYTGRINEKEHSVSIRSNKSELYLSYITDMDIWSKKLGVSSSKLEEYIFGVSRKENKSNSNPRIQLWRIIINNKQLFN